MSVKLRKRTLPSGKVELFLDIYYLGQRKKEYLHLYLNGERFHNQETQRLAEMKRAKRELQVQAEAHGMASSTNRKESFIDYMEQIRERSVSPRTKGSWANSINKFKEFRGGNDVTFGNLTKGIFEDFKDFLLGSVSQNTAQRYFAMIKTALYHAERHEMISSNPARFISIKKRESLPKFLTLEEVTKLWNVECGNESVRNGFLFSCFCGLRYSDVIRLRWDMINDNYVEFTQKKTGNSERIPLGRQALKILEEQKSVTKSDLVLREFEKGIIFFMPRQSTTDKVLKHWADRARLNKSISFHKARHTFATMALSYGVDLYTTSKLMGHRDLKTTQIYAKVIDQTKVRAVELLPVLTKENIWQEKATVG
ncbi:MAG: tyrosine-type recombinase/integrase [Bacteroidota bacterium]